MKVIFIVQGEGRGHLTQALTLEKALRDCGHEVTEILVGRSRSREVPSFFLHRTQAPVYGFLSPNFLPSKANQKVGLTRSIIYNIFKSPKYLSSIQYLHEHIQSSGADLVVNFYEVLTGLTYFIFQPHVPEVCIGHQYMFLHPSYPFPKKHKVSQKLMLAFTRATCLGATRKLGLSFSKTGDYDEENLSVVPPLLRDEALKIQRSKGDYMTGYIINAGFSDSVMQWHANHRDISLHFFWDKKDADETTQIDDTLTFHRIDDQKFLYYLANCKAYATTGGFESVCEAMYMGKPAMMVPVHVEQECNAHEAMLEGAGIKSDSFNMDQLIAFSQQYTENTEFRTWENGAKMMIVARLEAAVEQYNNTATNKGYGVAKLGRKLLVKSFLHNFYFKNY